jgi:hypothetical protein
MRFYIASIIIVVIPTVHAYPQDGSVNSARSLALSGVNVTLTECWSGLNNQAGLAFQSDKVLGINCNNRFMVSELSTQTVIANIPTAAGTLASSFSYFGGSVYHEDHLSLAFGKELLKWLSAGIGLNYHYFEVDATNRRAEALSGDIGVLLMPLDGFRIGLQVFNLTKSKYNNSDKKHLASGLKLGITYSEENNFLLGSQIDWDDHKQLNVLMGAECLLMKSLFVRFGIKLPYNTSYSFGIGTHLKHMNLDLGFEQHPCLGLSSALSWTLELDKNDK